MGPTNSSDKNDLTTTTLHGEPISPQASDTSTVTPMPTGADMPSMTPSAPTMAADPMNADTSGIDIIPNASSTVAVEASSGLPAEITTPGVTSSEISSTVPNIDTPTGADMPSMTPSAPTMAADPMNADTSGIDIIPNAGSPENTTEAPSAMETSVMGDPTASVETSSMPTGADMPSMTPSAPTMAADPIAANEPGPIQMNPSAPAAPASMAPSSTVLAPTPVKKKNNIVIIGTAILLIAMLIVLVVVYQRTKS